MKYAFTLPFLCIVSSCSALYTYDDRWLYSDDEHDVYTSDVPFPEDFSIMVRDRNWPARIGGRFQIHLAHTRLSQTPDRVVVEVCGWEDDLGAWLGSSACESGELTWATVGTYTSLDDVSFDIPVPDTERVQQCQVDHHGSGSAVWSTTLPDNRKVPASVCVARRYYRISAFHDNNPIPFFRSIGLLEISLSNFETTAESLTTLEPELDLTPTQDGFLIRFEPDLPQDVVDLFGVHADWNPNPQVVPMVTMLPEHGRPNDRLGTRYTAVPLKDGKLHYEREWKIDDLSETTLHMAIWVPRDLTHPDSQSWFYSYRVWKTEDGSVAWELIDSDDPTPGHP